MFFEVALSGFQILRTQIKRVGLLCRVAADPLGRHLISQLAFQRTGFGACGPVYRRQHT